MSSLLGLRSPSGPPQPIPGSDYIQTLHKYLSNNLARFSPSRNTESASLLQQSYTLLTLGLDPKSAPLSRNVKVPLTLGFGTPSTAPQSSKPVLLRLPPDRILYLLLRWQTLPQGLPHVGRTDEPIPSGVSIGARGAKVGDGMRRDGDVESVRSWVGSMRSVSMGSMKSSSIPGMGWFKKEEPKEDDLLLQLYSIFTVLPALLIHPPFFSDRPIAELIEAGGYTQLGGIDVRIPLDVLRNLQILELEGYDPRGLLVPPSHTLRSLTVRDVQDADDWIVELLAIPSNASTQNTSDPPETDEEASTQEFDPRFPNLRHLCIHNGSLLDLPSLPLSKLTHLDLSHNLLSHLPPSLSSLHSLQFLNLSDNVITSLRSAPSILGNLSTLNLARNRIDCVVGLERVMGLERVDLRQNAIEQWDEIGRLAELPVIKGIWYLGNPFAEPLRLGGMGGMGPDEVRVELGVMFAQQGHEGVVFDDKPFNWNEQRKIEQALEARGIAPKSIKRGDHGHHTSASREGQVATRRVEGGGTHQTDRPTPNRLQAYSSDRNSVTDTSRSNPSPANGSTRTRSDVATPKISNVTKKRRPRRLINLDEPEPQREERYGSLKLAPSSATDGDHSDDANVNASAGVDALKVKKKEKRAVSASMFEPSRIERG